MMNVIITSLTISLGLMLASVVTVQASEPLCGVVATENSPLNIRQEADSSAEVIYKARKGSALRILETAESWYQVKLNNGDIGYASRDYITTDEPCGVVITQNSPLNIRQDATRRSPVISQASKDSALPVLAMICSWYQVLLNSGIAGYVSRDYLKIQGFESSRLSDNCDTSERDHSTYGPPSGLTSSTRHDHLDAQADYADLCGLVITQEGFLEIRAESSKTARVVSRAIKDSAVRILRTVGSWYRVKLNDGTVGYAPRDWLKREDDMGGYVFCGMVATEKPSVSIYASIDGNSRVLGQAQTGTAVLVLNVIDSWYQVKLNDGTIGYVESDGVRYNTERYHYSN